MTALQPGRPSPVPSLANLRDLGGWTTRDGGRIRNGRLYRSSGFSELADPEVGTYENLAIETVYDLRSAAERDAAPDPELGGQTVIALDVLADSSTAIPANLATFFSDPKAAVELSKQLADGAAIDAIIGTYRELITLGSAQASYRSLLSGLASGSPSLFHCTAGKDRTGWAAALVLSWLGVGADDVYTDYLLTNERLVPSFSALFDSFAKAGGDPDLLLPILGVREEYLHAAFDQVQTDFGSLDNYVSTGLGIDDATANALRESLVE